MADARDSSSFKPETPPQGIYLFSQPRSASNLVLRLFAKHHQLSTTSYPFFDAFATGPDKLMRNTKGEGGEAWRSGDASQGPSYQSALDQL